MSARVLVAGVGNIFFGDDGFGCEVLRAVQPDASTDVKIEDFGIAGMHLGYELANGYEHAIIVDCVQRGGAPGTLYVIEPDVQAAGELADAHRMDLQNVFAFVRALGAASPPIEIVGCEPHCVDEGIGLSAPVSAALDAAVALVRTRIAAALSSPRPSQGDTTWSEAS